MLRQTRTYSIYFYIIRYRDQPFSRVLKTYDVHFSPYSLKLVVQLQISPCILQMFVLPVLPVLYRYYD
jgi:hypothetical protein